MKNEATKDTVTDTTCQAAQELSKRPGARIFWRPGGVVNWMLPELDPAQVLEGVRDGIYKGL